MTNRRTIEETTLGLETTSAKIRALARAGYDRSEIAEHLGVPYQHVRKVLLDAGITGGLRRRVEAEREPVTVDETPAPRTVTASEVLLRAGFQSIGQWKPHPDAGIILEAAPPTVPGVYAFAIDNVVAYIGLTNNSLKARLEQYRRGHEGQRTNARLKARIGQALSEGRRVQILIATPQPMEWCGLPVNVAAGLEAGLIEMIRPAWNIVGSA